MADTPDNPTTSAGDIDPTDDVADIPDTFISCPELISNSPTEDVAD